MIFRSFFFRKLLFAVGMKDGATLHLPKFNSTSENIVYFDLSQYAICYDPRTANCRANLAAYATRDLASHSLIPFPSTPRQIPKLLETFRPSTRSRPFPTRILALVEREYLQYIRTSRIILTGRLQKIPEESRDGKIKRAPGSAGLSSTTKS